MVFDIVSSLRRYESVQVQRVNPIGGLSQRSLIAPRELVYHRPQDVKIASYARNYIYGSDCI